MSKKKAKNSRAKGSRGELLLRDFLRSLGFESAKRTQQYNGLGKGDVECPDELPDVHIESKVGNAKKWDVGVDLIDKAVAQARRDADGKPWVVMWKPDRKCWRLTTEMQPEGYPRSLATVTDPETIAAILISKQLEAQGKLVKKAQRKPKKASKPVKTPARKPENKLLKLLRKRT